MTPAEYSQYLYHPRTDKYALLGSLKLEGDYSKIRKIYKSLSNNQFVKSIVKANCKAIDFASIRKQKDIGFSRSLLGELSWTLLCIEENRKILENFVVLKQDFEKELLLGKYENARATLKAIDDQTGKSSWLIESTLLLEEYQNGVEENWKFLSEISKVINDPIVLISSEHLSKRAESKVSYFRFNNTFSNQIDDLKSHKGLWEYFNFKLNPSNVNEYSQYAFIVYFENSSPLVDRFLTLKQVLYGIFCSDNFDANLLLDIYKRLHNLFPADVEILQILSLLDSSYLRLIPRSAEIEEIFELYNQSKYELVIDRAANLLIQFPTCMELYELYIKSLIENGMVSQRNKFPYLVDQIVDTLCKIYGNDKEFDLSWDVALKLGISFQSCVWARQYLSIIKSATSINSINKNFDRDFVAFSTILNPRLLYFVESSGLQSYIELFQSLSGQSATLKIATAILLADYSQLQSTLEISSLKLDLYEIRILMRGRVFSEARRKIEIMLDETSSILSIIVREELLVHLFRCYLHLNMASEACILFVDNYLTNNRTVKRFNTSKLLSRLDNDSSFIIQSIEFPIFLKIATTDSYKQYVGYDTYLNFVGTNRPSELLKDAHASNEKLIYFLKEVCTIEVMHHSYEFEGTEDIENERIKILNRLILIGDSEEPEIIQELSELNQSDSIRRAMREVNKGRISINVKQLRETESQNIREAYSRLKEVELYSKNRDLFGIDATNLINEMNTTELDDFDPNKVVYTSDPAFISFKMIFIEIRDKFLLSKEYGLDGYLSTRIRHGTLLNHIRSVFESHNILSQRDKDGNYLESDFWILSLTSSGPEKLIQVGMAINDFSNKIDLYTDSIIQDFLQVRTEKYQKKPKGWFDYSFSGQEIGYLFTVAREQIKDPSTFINFIFEFLEEKTEIVLDEIRNKLMTEVKEVYDSYLSSLYSELEVIYDGNPHLELKNSINLCGTALQQELSNITEWFHLSNTSKDIILDLTVLIQTAVQITNTIYPNFIIRPKILQSEKVPLAGTLHLIYVFRILFDNIITHSRLQPNELEIEVKTETVSSDLKLSFKNNFSTDIPLDQLNNKLLAVKRKWESEVRDFEKVDVEGDSGFDKISRIIAFDLEIKNYAFDYIIHDSFLEIIVSLSLPKILNFDANEDFTN